MHDREWDERSVARGNFHFIGHDRSEVDARARVELRVGDHRARAVVRIPQR